MYQYPPLRSIDADRIRCFVRFKNLTSRKVDIIWVNFTGEYVRYECLESGQYLDVNTFKHHPWIAFDHISKDRLHLDKQFVYQPQTSRDFFVERYPDIPRHRIEDIIETRIMVKITLPVYSLRFSMLLFLKNYFRTPEEVDVLDLPKHLLENLKSVITARNNQNLVPLMRIT